MMPAHMTTASDSSKKRLRDPQFRQAWERAALAGAVALHRGHMSVRKRTSQLQPRPRHRERLAGQVGSHHLEGGGGHCNGVEEISGWSFAWAFDRECHLEVG